MYGRRIATHALLGGFWGFLPFAAYATTAIFIENGGLWSEPSNWSPPIVPNGPNDIAIIPDNFFGPFISIDEPIRLASLQFIGATGGAFLSSSDPSDTLTLYTSLGVDSGSEGPAIFVTIVLPNTIPFEIESNYIEIATITGPGGVTLTGGGRFRLNGGGADQSSYTGMTTVVSGSFEAAVFDVITFPPNSPFVLADDPSVLINIQDTFQTILSLSGGGPLGGNVLLGVSPSQLGSLTTGDSTDTTYGGSISGYGPVIKQGSGTFTLLGASSYTGGTFLNAGQITLGNNAALGPALLTMADGTTLSLNDGVSAVNEIQLPAGGIGTISVPSGTGSLTGNTDNTTGILSKSGDGVLVLSGDNQHSGGTVLVAGQITVASNTGLGSGLLTMSDGTTLGLNDGISVANSILIASGGTATLSVPSGTTTLTGPFSTTTGGLTKSGNGILNLSGLLGYSGTTAIDGGVLALSGSATLPIHSPLVIHSGSLSLLGLSAPQMVGSLSGSGGILLGSGGLIVDSALSTTYSGSISGSGGLTKAGSGILTLTGVNPLTGNSAVSGGTLSVQGSLDQCTLTVQAGATLKGTGTLGTVIVDGTLRAGNSIGTLTGRSFLMESGSTLITEINAGNQASLVVATETFTIDPGSTFELIADCGPFQGEPTYTIVTAGSVSGTFSSVRNTTLPRFSPSLVYLEDAIELSLTPIYFQDVLEDAALGCCQARHVAGYLDCLYFNGLIPCESDLSRVITVLNGATPCELSFAFDQLHPAPYAAMLVAQQYSSLNYLDTLVDRLDQTRTLASYGWDDACAHVWLTPFGSLAKQGSLCDQLGYHAREKGITLGADAQGEHWLLGAAIGYTSTHMEWSSSYMGASLQSYHAALFGRAFGRYAYLDLAIGGAGDTYHGSRSIQFASLAGSIQRTACWDVDGGEVDLYVGLGVNTHDFPVDLAVEGSVDWMHMHRSAFVEHGAGDVNLSVQRESTDLLRTEVRLWASKQISSWVPQLGLAVAYDHRPHALLSGAFASECGNGCSMCVDGLAPSRFLIIPRAKITQVMNDKFSIALSYEGDFADEYSENTLWLELGYAF
ncbi:MAG: autotransporter outer membrane beta-barrel domain-containing protein [Chlamydiia bacterium]